MQNAKFGIRTQFLPAAREIVQAWTGICPECDAKVIREFRHFVKGGKPLAFQCQECGEIFIGATPGVEKYTRPEADRLRSAILEAFLVYKPRMSIRQVFYYVAVKGYVEKSKAGARQVQARIKKMREDGTLPWGWISDNTRYISRPRVHDDLKSAMEDMRDNFRRDFWAHQSDHIEIWLEKDALAGVIAPITQLYGVPLYVVRGFSSDTFLVDAAEELSDVDKQVFVYYFGDFDPSGVNIAEKVRDGLAYHGANIWFSTVSILPGQIDALDLPKLPVNRKDPRAKKWTHNFVVELDALPKDILQDMVRWTIETHIDRGEWTRLQAIEAAEKATLDNMIKNFSGDGNP